MVVTSHEYLPFGEDWITEGDTKNAPKYNSQELDKESGYYFYNARHYDPEIGRFVTPDTVIDGELSTQGWNRFAYCKGNPIIYKDPTGHSVSGSWNTGGASGSWASAGEKISNAFSSAVNSVKNFFSGNNQNEYNNQQRIKNINQGKVTKSGSFTVEKTINYPGGGPPYTYTDNKGKVRQIENKGANIDIISGDFYKNPDQWNNMKDFKDKPHYKGGPDRKNMVDLTTEHSSNMAWWGPNDKFKVNNVVIGEQGSGTRISISTLDEKGNIKGTVDLVHMTKINKEIIDAQSSGKKLDAGTFVGFTDREVGYNIGTHLHVQADPSKNREYIQNTMRGR